MTNPARIVVSSLRWGYVVPALAVAAVLSPPALSALPLLLIALFIYAWLRPARLYLNFSLNLYLFIAMPILYEPVMSAGIAASLSAPILTLLDADLRGLASRQVFRDWTFRRRPGGTLLALASVAGGSLALSALLGKAGIMITSTILTGYVLFLLALILKAGHSTAIEADSRRHRIVADQQISFVVPLRSRSGLAAWLHLVAPYPWVRLRPTTVSLAEGAVDLKLSLTPPLAGPASVHVGGFVLDRWGLVQQKIELGVAEIQVIPRATYAAWLASQYLETSTTEGTVATALSPAPTRRWMHSRRGIEYYGNRLYQPGDTLRSIDWKRSLKLEKIVVKEYDSPQASAAVLLVNLTVGDAQEADRLVFAWITTAITLAREGIPALMATYDRHDAVATTDLLGPRDIVLTALAMSAGVSTWARPRKYLRPPDLTRARSNSRRLRMLGAEPAEKLAGLLDMEFAALRQTAAANPATKALTRGLRRATSRPTVLFLSARNHDAEALEVARYDLASRRYDCADVPIAGPTISLVKSRPKALA